MADLAYRAVLRRWSSGPADPTWRGRWCAIQDARVQLDRWLASDAVGVTGVEVAAIERSDGVTEVVVYRDPQSPGDVVERLREDPR